MAIRVHKSSVGTFHPVPIDDVAWTVNDTRGYMEYGPSCSECGACECSISGCDAYTPLCQCDCYEGESECIGLSFTYICLDGGDILCEECAVREGLEVIECDCG